MSVGRDVAVVLVAFCIEVLDSRTFLRKCASTLDEPETTLAVLMNTDVSRDCGILAVKSCNVAGRSF